MKKTFPMIIKPYQGEGIRSPCSARPKAKLSWDMLTSADDPAKLVREAGSQWPSFHYVRLPEGIYCWWMLVSKTLRISQGRVVPTAAGAANPAGLSRAEGPKGDFTVTFGPCANLMIYTGHECHEAMGILCGEESLLKDTHENNGWQCWCAMVCKSLYIYLYTCVLISWCLACVCAHTSAGICSTNTLVYMYVCIYSCIGIFKPNQKKKHSKFWHTNRRLHQAWA